MKYYLIDDQKRKQGVFETNDKKYAKEMNDGYWGVFWTPNLFKGARKLENLEKIRYWYVDIDKCNKADTIDRIQKSPAYPSNIVETKSGFHLYWEAIDATVDNFQEIEDRLINYFDADPQVKDIPRLLRVPNFTHYKDLDNPFLIDLIDVRDYAYSERKMLFAFPAIKRDVRDDHEQLESLDGVDLHVLLKPQEIYTGNRNGSIFNKGVFLKKIGLGRSDVEDALIWLNNNIIDPLPDSEVEAIIRGYDSWDR